MHFREFEGPGTQTKGGGVLSHPPARDIEARAPLRRQKTNPWFSYGAPKGQAAFSLLFFLLSSPIVASPPLAPPLLRWSQPSTSVTGLTAGGTAASDER